MSKLTVVVPGEDHPEEISYAGRFIIDEHTAILHADLLYDGSESMNKNTIEYAKIVYQDINEDNWHSMGKGPLHVVGRVDLSLKMNYTDQPYVWKYPETHVHPAYQSNLADVLILLSVR